MATISQINIDGSTYDISDAKLKKVITNFYDSDTKSINLSSSDSTPAITVKSPIFCSNSDPAPDHNLWGGLIQFNDNTETLRSYIRHVALVDGRQGIQLETRRYNSDDQAIFNYIELFINSNGADTVSLTYPAVWREALGFGTDISTDTISNIITPESNFTIVSASYRQRHGIALLEMRFQNKTAISVPNHGNIGDMTIGTLVSGKRPILATHPRSNGDEAGQAWFHIDIAGRVILCAAEGTGTARTIPANTTYFNLSAMYIVA